MNTYEVDTEAYSRHLRTRVLELWALPMRSIHEPTGLPVWLLLNLVIDAYARVEDGLVG